jgi:hypothetical protein
VLEKRHVMPLKTHIMCLQRNRSLFENFLELFMKRKSKQGTDPVRVDSCRGHKKGKT